MIRKLKNLCDAIYRESTFGIRHHIYKCESVRFNYHVIPELDAVGRIKLYYMVFNRIDENKEKRTYENVLKHITDFGHRVDFYRWTESDTDETYFRILRKQKGKTEFLFSLISNKNN